MREAEEVITFYADKEHIGFDAEANSKNVQWVGDHFCETAIENGFKAKAYLEKYKNDNR